MRGPRAALHPLEGDGLGGVRPRRSARPSGSGSRARSSGGERCAQAIHDEVCARGYDAELQSFVQRYGSTQLDASLLLIPDRRLPAAGRSAHRAAPSRRSSAQLLDGRVRAALRHGGDRRRAAAGRGRLPGVQLLARRRLRAARARSTTRGRCSSGCSRCATTSGCWPRSTTRALGRLVGNFPQAFSHVALVNTAHNLTKAAKPAEQRAARG